ncbi:flavodoxin family protein [Dasania marina]|uniref:flavodoxin family protein n=1 Tax=Dasania marina TaxID=471499 RepID=UPI0030D8F0C0|tara:strand:- start:27662 stop:28111 length:450 start_codon:yes stop_codon:yes gene_type:complete
MKKILIVYHSQSGNTAQLARAVLKGASADAEVSLLPAMEAGVADLQACDAVIFGSPENFGYLSGGLKDFLDRTFYPLEPYQLNIPYGCFISAGNDGSGAVRQLERIAKGYPLRKVADPVIVKGQVSEGGLNLCEELGATFAAALAMGIF